MCFVFLRVRKTKAIFYIDFLRKTTAGRPFWETMGTTRDTIGTDITQAGFGGLPELGFAHGSVQVLADTKGRVLITATSGSLAGSEAKLQYELALLHPGC